MRRLTIRTVAIGAGLALAVPAFAATKNGVTPVSPKSGVTTPAGGPLTFRARARGGGTVWVHVCKSKRRNREGIICNREYIRQMKTKKDGVYRHRVDEYTHPTYWLNTVGTYYWQVHRIKCQGSTRDCRQEGPIYKLRVG